MMHTQRTVRLAAIAVLTIGGLSLSAQQPRSRAPTDSRMSGTYDLETTRGGSVQIAAATATRSLPPAQRDRAYQTLLARLEPPQRLSIERQGWTILIASNRGPRAEFDADGRTRSERGQDGRMVNTRSEIVGNQLRVSTSGGSRGSDYSVTFESQNNGANLRVTRRLDDPDLRRPVTFQSYYRRTALEPYWDVYTDGPGYGRGAGYARGRGNDDRGTGFGWMGWMGSNAGADIMPYGTRLVATLDTPISMRQSRNGETFSMTVRGPGEFQGARIDGVISRIRAERGNGMDLRMDFQRIEMRGRSSDFDAVLNTVRLADGTVIRVNDEGDLRESNGGRTVRNGAIGAGVGAIIGAFIAGGKGAAIGAAVGGVGGVIVSQGHERLDLPRGAEVTLTALPRYRTP